ncbi:MAG: hypothetical protein ACI8V2_003490 [Candidatus Latescibacterota bacterium]|jgi:hypothetical protein
MGDLLKTLEEHSRTWNAISRQGLADGIWFHYVRARFRRTGDTRALEYLYPYLSNARTRHQAGEWWRVENDATSWNGSKLFGRS